MKKKRMYSSNEKKEYFIIFLCWLVYSCAYIGRYSYTANMTVIGDFYGISDSKILGLASTFFFATYGIGQFVNAFLCKYYSKRIIITISLAVSSIINFILSLKIPFESIKYFWLLNAVAQSILWPTLIQTISMYVGKDKMKTAVIAMAITVPVGTVIVYAMSSLFVKVASYNITFIVTAIFLLITAFVWFFGFGKVSKEITPCSSDQITDDKNPEKVLKEEGLCKNDKRKKGMPRSFYATFIILLLFAILNSLIKDGLTSWMPSIMKDIYGLGDSTSIISVILLPLLGIFSAFLATSLGKYIKDFVIMSGIFFAGSGIFILCLLGLFNTNLCILAIICFGLISLLTHSINNIITSMFSLYMPNNGKAGFYSGMLNAACYVGSAFSGYGLGMLVDIYDEWNPIFQLLLVCCILPFLTALIVLIIKIFKKKKNSLPNTH